eukprot:5231778-Prymnesium_polylepis.2
MPAGWSYAKCGDTQKLCFKHLTSGRVQWERPYPRGSKRPPGINPDADVGDGDVRIVAARTAEEAANARFKQAKDRGEIIDISSPHTGPLGPSGRKRARVSANS